MQLAPIASAVAEVPALVDADTENTSVVAEPLHAAVAEELAQFLGELRRTRVPVGIAAFVLCALVYRKRFRIWYADTSADIVETYAPWAGAYITESATVDAVGCRCEAVSYTHLTLPTKRIV